MNFANLFKNEPDPKRYSAGESIIVAGDDHQVMMVLLEGEAEVRIGDQVVEVETTGSVFGEMALIGTRVSTADVVARTDVTVAEVDERRFNFLVQQHPTFAIEMMRLIADRLENMNRRLEED